MTIIELVIPKAKPIGRSCLGLFEIIFNAISYFE